MDKFQFSLTDRGDLIVLTAVIRSEIFSLSTGLDSSKLSLTSKFSLDVPYNKDIGETIQDFLDNKTQILNFKTFSDPTVLTQFYILNGVMHFVKKHRGETFEIELTEQQKQSVLSIFRTTVEIINARAK